MYILKRYLINYLVNEKSNISSLKGEFVPSIISGQFKRVLTGDQYNPYEIEDISKSFQSKSKEAGDAPKKSVYSYIRVDKLKKELDRFDPLNENLEKQCEPLSYPHSLLSCSPVVVDSEKYFITRSNSLLSYYEINKRAGFLVPDHRNAEITDRSNRVFACIVGEHSKLMGKTTLNRSIIGNHCTINPKVTLENCVLMDNVVIGEGCIIKDSIICHDVVVGERCRLNSCVVAANEKIDQSTTLANESVVHTDQMMEL